MSIWEDLVERNLVRAESYEVRREILRQLVIDHEAFIRGEQRVGRVSSNKRTKYNHRKNWNEAPWMKLLHKLRDLNPEDFNHSRENKYFRLRFRVPYPLFLKLLNMFKDNHWLGSEVDCCGQQCCPYELKLLSTLRILGRGVCFDNNLDGCMMEPETARVWFHIVCKLIKVHLFPEYVRPPSGEKLNQTMHIYSVLGFPGAVGSFDVDHV